MSLNLGDSVTLSKKSKGLIIFAQQLYIPLFFWFLIFMQTCKTPMKDGGLYYSWRAQGTKTSLPIAKKEMNSSVSNSTVLTLTRPAE